jgi:hypothetical protein
LERPEAGLGARSPTGIVGAMSKTVQSEAFDELLCCSACAIRCFLALSQLSKFAPRGAPEMHR